MISLLHEPLAYYRAVSDRYSSFGGEEPVSGSADLGVLLAWDISKEDIGGHKRWSSAYDTRAHCIFLR
jgi:hypothetical protein